MTTLSPQLLRACLLVASFRGEQLDRIQAFLLLLLLRVESADAGRIPAELLEGNKQICGIGTDSF